MRSQSTNSCVASTTSMMQAPGAIVSHHMPTIRVERPPPVIGSAAEPAAAVVPTGGAGERLEAQLLIVHGTVTSKPVRSTAGNVAFSVDDGTWSAIGSAGEVLTAATPDELDRKIRGHWQEMQ